MSPALRAGVARALPVLTLATRRPRGRTGSGALSLLACSRQPGCAHAPAGSPSPRSAGRELAGATWAQHPCTKVFCAVSGPRAATENTTGPGPVRTSLRCRLAAGRSCFLATRMNNKERKAAGRGRAPRSGPPPPPALLPPSFLFCPPPPVLRGTLSLTAQTPHPYSPPSPVPPPRLAPAPALLGVRSPSCLRSQGKSPGEPAASSTPGPPGALPLSQAPRGSANPPRKGPESKSLRSAGCTVATAIPQLLAREGSTDGVQMDGPG